MATYSEIPTEPGRPFSEGITINGYEYTIRFAWNVRANVWVMEFWDTSNTIKLVCGVPLVTGADLLEQFVYDPLGQHAMLTVMSIGPAISPDTVPTFDNLGVDGHLYIVTPTPL